MLNRPLSRNIIIALIAALVIVIALIATARYFIVRYKRVEPKQPSQSVAIPEDILRSLTPPEGAVPAVIDQKTLDSLTPPEGAKPAEIPQSVLDSLTPPARL